MTSEPTLAALSLPNRYDTLSPGLRLLAERGVVKTYRKGQRLIDEGANGDTLYIILSGRLRAFARGGNGREITYGTYGPGEYVGEMSLDGGPRSANVEALEAVDCVQITRQTLLAHLREQPEFALDLLAKVIRRARAATLSARQLALNDAYGRLVSLFHTLARPRPDGSAVIAERPTHHEIAGRIGCSREMVSRLLKDLERGGYVASAGDALLLLRPLPARW